MDRQPVLIADFEEVVTEITGKIEGLRETLGARLDQISGTVTQLRDLLESTHAHLETIHLNLAQYQPESGACEEIKKVISLVQLDLKDLRSDMTVLKSDLKDVKARTSF